MNRCTHPHRYKEGDIMLMSDHLNMPGLAGFNPLRGPNDERFGVRFPGMNQAYDKDIRTICRAGAKELDIDLKEGVYAFVCG